MAPVFRFRTVKGSDGLDGNAVQPKPGPVTNAGEIEVAGGEIGHRVVSLGQPG